MMSLTRKLSPTPTALDDGNFPSDRAIIYHIFSAFCRSPWERDHGELGDFAYAEKFYQKYK